MLLMFMGVTAFSAFRYGIGYDYYAYLDCCKPGSFRGNYFEPIPFSLVKFSQKTSPYYFFIITSVFISYFYFKGIRNIGRNYMEATMFYLCFPFFFFNQLSIVRQGLATSVIFFALTLESKYKNMFLSYGFRIILILLAAQCHRSAYIGFLLLLPWGKVPAKVLWIIFVTSFFLGSLIISISLQVLDSGVLERQSTISAYAYIKNESQIEGKMIRYLIYVITFVILLLYKKLVKMDKRNAYYIGLVVLGCSIYTLFAFNISLSKRLSMFFFTSSIIVVPQLLPLLKVKKAVYYGLCIALFTLQVYISSHNMRPEDRLGFSVSYPYRTFFDRL